MPLIPEADRMQFLAPHFFASWSAKIAELEANGADIIRMDEGSPDLPPPDFIIEAMIQSARLSSTHRYQPHKGTRRLREAWSGLYARQYHVNLDPDVEILPLIGSKEGIFHSSLAWVNPGDIVLVPDPGYVTYTKGTLTAGGIPFTFPLRQENNYLPDINSIPPEVIRKAKLIWLNYPNNPTASTASKDFFAEVVEFGRKHQILICHDAAYSHITFDGYRAPSILEVPGATEVAVEFNTLSKSHNMAGWRTGVALGNAKFLRSLFVVKTNLDSGHFLPILEASIAALNGDQSWQTQRNEIYRQRRDIVVKALHDIGFPVSSPKGSLYVWTPIPEAKSSYEFAQNLLQQAGVSFTPGDVFGEAGAGFLRISLTTPTDRVQEAMQRIKAWKKLG